jgi:uroporphyrinogen-III synthase
MREVPLEDNHEAFEFAERLFRGEFEMIILLTGVGTRMLANVLATRYPAERFMEALRGMTVVARGSKPAAVLREMRVPITIMVPEPNTWREILSATEARPEKRIAIQEYGKPNTDLIEALRARGADVTRVRVYQWDLPEDTGPLREAVHRIAQGGADMVMFTTSVQVHHLFRMASEMGAEQELRAGLGRITVASVGPTTTEALEDFGLRPTFEPSHPKMGFLVKEALAQRNA